MLPRAVGAMAGLALLSLAGAIPVMAQSGDLKSQDTKPAVEAPKDAQQRKANEFSEAAQALNGPAGNPECVWLGRRVVGLMWRDDIDTAFRHLDLYDRFGCPGGHIQATFRCLVRFGAIDPKAPETLNARVHTCWVNPNTQAMPAAAPASAPAAASAPPAK